MSIFARQNKHTSSNIAGDRLKLVLTHDRARTTENTELLERLKHDILSVITEYVEIDEDRLTLSLAHLRSDSDTLSTEFSMSCPIRRVKKLPKNG